MKKIIDLFTNFFDSERITNLRLDTYTKDHLARLIANNPGGVFDDIINDTENAHNAFVKALNDVGGDIGDRKASTLTKEQARENFNAFIRQREGLIKSTFNKPSAPYTLFFPDGLSPYSFATDQEYELLVNNIVARANQFETELGTPFKDAATAAADAYLTAEQSQTNEKGDVSATRGKLATATAALTRQLTINALTIALQFPLDATKPEIYFETSLLFAQKRKHIFKGEPAAGATELVTDLKYEAGTTLRMKNKGAATLSFQMYLQGNPVGLAFTVTNGQELSKPMSAFYTNADALYVTNLGTVIGKYEVDEVA